MAWLHTTSKALPNVVRVDPFGGAYGQSRPNLDGMLYPDASFTGYALNGFGRNELVYACVMHKCRTLPQAVLRVYADGQAEPLEDHPLRKLILRPNDVTPEVEFEQLLIIHLDLSGSAFILIGRDLFGRPNELWPIRPDLVRVIPAARGDNPRNWRWGYQPENSTRVFPVERSDMIRIRYPNPLDSYFGQAPLRAATRAISVDNARTDYVDELLRNDAVPRVVIKTQSAIDEAVATLLEARWTRKFGPGNRGKPAFLQAGMDVEVLGLNLEQLEFGDLSATNEARVCMTLGVQPILIGAKVGLDRSTFSNFEEATSSFWETTLMDLQRMIVSGYRTHLVPEFTGVGRRKIDARWDNSDVLALQEAETDRWERATNALARGGITRNMFLETVGLDRVPGGDVFLTPAGVVEVDVDGRQRAEIGAPDAGNGNGQGDQGDGEGSPSGGGMRAVEAASYAEEFLRRHGVTGNGQRPPAGTVAQ